MKLLLPISFWATATLVAGNPSSKPYVPFRTSPLDQDTHHDLTIPDDHRKSNPTPYKQSDQCPLQFTLGLVKRSHHAPANTKSGAIIEPPSIYPVHPSYGSGRQVIHSTQYEHLDLLTPTESSDADREGLMQHQDYPLLFESSSFLGAPLVHDANGDGIPDAIMSDYDGGLYMVGLQVGKDGRRYMHTAQVPRLYIRREWMTSRLNATLQDQQQQLKNEELLGGDGNEAEVNEPNENDIPQEVEIHHDGDDHISYETSDPYHSYFEYGTHTNNEGVLRGVAADVLDQNHDHVQGLEERRQRKVNHERNDPEDERGEGHENLFEEEDFVDSTHRRLQEEVGEQGEPGEGGGGDERGDVSDVGDESQTDDQVVGDADESQNSEDQEPDMSGEGRPWPDDDAGATADHEGDDHYDGDDHEDDDHEDGEDEEANYRYGGYDDYYDSRYGGRQNHQDYYDDKHYIRLPPHILSSPVLADMKKAYGETGEREEMIFVAVSYYLDEDEYEGQFSYSRFENTDRGDETETDRGMHVASALVAYVLDTNPRFGREEHLDLSGDFSAPHNATMIAEIPVNPDDTKMGAFALAPPTIADIDGNGDEDVLLGTSMGIIYCMHARHMYNSDGWPVQIPNPVESRILVEDVMGDTNLEVFVLDTVANVYCFDARGNIQWRRDLLGSLSNDMEVRALSPMTMGDVDGDGVLDIVLALKVISKSGEWKTFLIAISAITGDDIGNFPIEFDSPLLLADGSADSGLLLKLAQPLLIDLHANQEHWQAYISRNGTKWNQPPRSELPATPPHGGNAPGLHVVQPVGSNLYIIEAGSGCTQKISIGEEIESMVQADDVHGTNNIDLVVSTKGGNIVTLESPAVPYHPLNVWNSGEVRGRRNNYAQGFTASQGIFVHDRSRQYRDIFGVYVPLTFEIFDNRPNIQNEQDKRVYNVEVRDGTSAKRAMFRKTYNEVGVFTERLYINYGPGYYTLTVLMRTSHGLIYEDSFHLGYNVHYMDGFGFLLWFPLCVASIFIFSCSRKKANWDDDEYDEAARGKNQGILGSPSSS